MLVCGISVSTFDPECRTHTFKAGVSFKVYNAWIHQKKLLKNFRSWTIVSESGTELKWFSLHSSRSAMSNLWWWFCFFKLSFGPRKQKRARHRYAASCVGAVERIPTSTVGLCQARSQEGEESGRLEKNNTLRWFQMLVTLVAIITERRRVQKQNSWNVLCFMWLFAISAPGWWMSVGSVGDSSSMSLEVYFDILYVQCSDG